MLMVAVACWKRWDVGAVAVTSGAVRAAVAVATLVMDGGMTSGTWPNMSGQTATTTRRTTTTLLGLTA